jgi:hypothetical protein
MADPTKAADANVTEHRERQSFKSWRQGGLQSHFPRSGDGSTLEMRQFPLSQRAFYLSISGPYKMAARDRGIDEDQDSAAWHDR